ncbi:N-acetylglucosamine-6-phosphate deacetylase NagA [Mycobacteroides abscessus subsp. abscessus]|nr:N-acetylglucosamine-6-phosphate deacetylase NagA [Mycobacteroides abscessus subsp. abscessus]
MATHLFNAMRPIHHREPGPIPALLESPDVTIELIADGVHIHPAIYRTVLAAVGPDRIALVTDAMCAAGMPDGAYQLGNLAVKHDCPTARSRAAPRAWRIYTGSRRRRQEPISPPVKHP